MTKNRELKDYKELIRACVKCGACQAHCPTYLEKRKEGAVARGKLSLAAALLEKDVGFEKRLLEDMSMCLMCGSCVNTCPNKVPTDKIVGAMRREISEDKGMSFVGKSVSALVGSKALMKGLTKGGALLSPLIFKKVPASSGLRLRFSPSSMKNRTVPHLPYKNLFEMYPEFMEGKKGKPVVGFFAGCSISYVYTEVGVSMVSLLQKMGCSIYLPKDQRCCGIPALSGGDGTLVEELADANIAAFTQHDLTHIITACASCNGGIGDYYAHMKGEHSHFSEHVVNYDVFLKKEGFVEKLRHLPKWKNRTVVTYHDPCHLKTQGILAEPRDILKALPNVEFVEMEGASFCCGMGGTFSASHYECSKAIGARKIPGLRESGAQKIATSCPGCILQLQDIINHATLPVKAVHILDLIHEALDVDSN